MRRPLARPPTWGDLRAPSEADLTAALRRIATLAVVGDTRAVRPEDRLRELLHLFLLKLESDRAASAAPQRPVPFRGHGDGAARARETAQAIRAQFRGYYQERRAQLFHPDDGDELRLTDETLAAAVEALAPWRILGSQVDLLAKALQVLRSDAVKAGEGQFLTPPRILTPCVQALQISAQDRVIDPACGSGGFLIEALRQLRARAPLRDAPDPFARDQLYGVDKDPLGVKLTRAALVALHGDPAHLLIGDAVRCQRWRDEPAALQRALCAPGGEVAAAFTVVITNPPFGEDLKVSAQDARAAGYTISSAASGSGEEHVDLEIGLVYLELAHRLLQAGGRVGIVLPETYFFSHKYRWLERWLAGRLELRGMLNIPMEAFEEFCRAKTNFYIFEKVGQAAAAPRPSWFAADRVLVSTAPTCGLSRGGRPLPLVDPATGARVKERDPDTGALVDAVNDQLRADMEALRRGDTTDTLRFVPRAEMAGRAAVPVYYDRRCQEAFDAAMRSPRFAGFTAAPLGELVQGGIIALHGGHGSPSPDQRVGDIPYIKVSDLRAGLVNINPTNRVPLPIAERHWRGKGSGLRAFDLLSPERTSKNIGDFCVLMPGQERVLLTKEIIVMRPGERADFDAFYLLWAMSLKIVRDQWRRVIFMQTNREDAGERYLEIRIPVARGPLAQEASAAFRDYYRTMAAAQARLSAYLERSAEHHFFMPGAEAPKG